MFYLILYLFSLSKKKLYFVEIVPQMILDLANNTPTDQVYFAVSMWQTSPSTINNLSVSRSFIKFRLKFLIIDERKTFQPSVKPLFTVRQKKLLVCGLSTLYINFAFEKFDWTDGDFVFLKIPETLIRYSLSKTYLENTLQYFSVPHWFTNNENISVKEKNLKFKCSV